MEGIASMLSKEAIIEFQAIFQREYGEALSIEDACASAEALLRLYKAVFKPSIDKAPTDAP